METRRAGDPDLTLTTDYDTAKKIFVDQDQAAGMQAFMAGKIKVQGDMMKMMAMQTAMPQDETAKRSPARSRRSPTSDLRVTGDERRQRFGQLVDRPLRVAVDAAPRDQLSIIVTLPPCTKNVSPVNTQSALAR